MKTTVEYHCETDLFPSLNKVLASRQILVEENICIPRGKPDIEQLVNIDVQVKIIEFKLLPSPTGRKCFIKGLLEQQILYVADGPCQPAHVFNFSAPFQTFVKLPCDCQIDYDELEECDPEILVEFMEAQLIGNRKIAKSIILFIWIPKVYKCRRTAFKIIAPPQRRCCHPVIYNCKPYRPTRPHRKFC